MASSHGLTVISPIAVQRSGGAELRRRWPQLGPLRPAGGRLLAALGPSLVLSAALFAAPALPPAPHDWVTDRSGFLSPATRDALDLRLHDYEQRSGHQVLVWIDRTSGGLPVEDFAARAFAAWRVGRRGADDGLVLFIFSDQGRARIEVGYGLEERVPDIVASRLLREELAVAFASPGAHDAAVVATVEGVLNAIETSPAAAPAAPQAAASGKDHVVLWIVVAVAGLILLGLNPSLALNILFFFLSNAGSSGNRERKGWMGQGGRSGGGGANV